MMDPTIKRGWIDALESEKYIKHDQYSLYLKTDKGYNFLGVLLEEFKLTTFTYHISQKSYTTSHNNFYDIRYIAKKLNFDDKRLYNWTDYSFSIVAILIKLDPNL